jgi:CRISPR-associated protein Cmr4
MTEFLLYLYAESPVHAGASDSLDVLDLPVQREASTGYPVIWGQSLKGALRQAARESGGWNGLVTQVFGSEPGDQASDGGTTAGLLAVGDAQLVAMPVPTLRRTFAWVTSEIALGRLARKYKALGREALPVPVVAQDRGAAPDEEWTRTPDEVLGPCVVALGETPDEGVRGWAGLLAGDAIGGEEVFGPFAAKLRTDLLLAGSDIVPALLRECTEQAVRVQLDDAKTVENGPFYSEYLPAETILAASLTLRRPAGRSAAPGDHERHAGALRALLDGRLLRVGGDETLGKGLVWGRLIGEAAAG